MTEAYKFENGMVARELLTERERRMRRLLRRASMWLGKMIADGGHLNTVMPRDCENTLEHIERVLDETKDAL